MNIDTKKCLLIISWFSIIYGLWDLIKNIKPTYWTLKISHGSPGSWSFKYYLFIIGVTLILCVLIPIIRIIGGALLLRSRQLGRRLIILTSIVDFVIGFNAALNMVFLSIYLVPLSKLDPNVTVMKINMWPMYIFALIGLIVIYFLNRGNVKELLK